MFQKIAENIRKDSRECSRRFRAMFGKIPGNITKNSGELIEFKRNGSSLFAATSSNLH